MSISVIIPTLNEEEAIEDVLTRIKNTIEKPDILVVDKSTDKTADIARRNGARVLLQKGKGFGNAVMMGLEKVKNEQVILIDGDCTYWPEDIPTLIEELDKGNDIVLGNRFIHQDPNSMYLLNRIGNHFLSRLIRHVFGTHAIDTQSGLRAVQKSKIKRMNLKEQGFGYYTEMLIQATRAGLCTSEIPIRFSPRVGISKLNPIKEGVVVLIVIMRLWRELMNKR